MNEVMGMRQDVSLMNLEDLQGTVFWSGAAVAIVQEKIKAAKHIGGMQAQVDAWLVEAQAITEHKVRAQQRLGEIAEKEPQERPQRGASLGSTSLGPPKWKRLGFKSKKAMAEAAFLKNNPKAVDETIAEAKDSDDVISTGAIKNKVRAEKAEKRLKEAQERAAAKTEKAVDKEVEENKRFVAEYFEAVKAYAKALTLAVRGADKFDPDGRNFLINKHEKLNNLMTELEESV